MHDLVLAERRQIARQPMKAAQDTQSMVVVVSDDATLAMSLEAVCDFLSIAVEHVSSADDLEAVLAAHRPMAVVTEMDCQQRDGFDVMMTVSRHDPDLPIMLLIGDDPVLTGASEAIEDLFGLTAVARSERTPKVGALVDFFFNAGRRSGSLRMMPI